MLARRVLVAAGIAVAAAVAAPLLPPADTSFAALDTAVRRARPVPYDPRGANATWAIEASCCGYGPFTAVAVNASSLAVGGLFDLPCGRPNEPTVAEWGYEYQHNGDGIFPVCGNETADKYPAPVDRSQALSRLATYWRCRVANATAGTPGNTSAGVFSMMGHYLWTGVSGAIGAVAVAGSEVGENINSVNGHWAVSRGASRQFGVPFTIDFSAWMQGYILDYSHEAFWGSASSPIGGHSLELFKRVYYGSFAAGAGSLIAEAGAVNFFVDPVNGSQLLPVSPLGAIGAAFYNYTHAGVAAPALVDSEAVRGIPYVPIAIVTPVALGMGIGWWYNALAWDTLPYLRSDVVTRLWLETVWPQSWLVMNEFGTGVSESHYLVASPYGELFDILLDGPLGSVPPPSQTPLGSTAPTPAEVLAAYRVVVLAGLGIDFTPALCAALDTYVAASNGTVWLSADDIAAAPAGCFSASFLGGAIGNASSSVMVSAVTDVFAPPPPFTSPLTLQPSAWSPFCVPQTSGGAAWYIKTGGDPNAAESWDGGVMDKCCRVDVGDCYWFASQLECEAALLITTCEACGPGDSGIGCPSWQQAESNASIAIPTTIYVVSFTPAPTSTAAPWLTSSDGVPLAIHNAYGGGAVLLALTLDDALWAPAGGNLAAGGAARAGFAALDFALSRLSSELTPVSVSVDAASAAAGRRIMAQYNRRAADWVVTLTNNNGVVKQPATAVQIDAAALINATVTSLSLHDTASAAISVAACGSPSSAAGIAVCSGPAVVTVAPGDAAVVLVPAP